MLTMVVVISMVVAIGALVVACVAFRLARPDTREIVLVDDGGRPRVRVAATSNGGAIELLDERGRARIALQQAGAESSISMRQKEKADEASDYAIRLVVDAEKQLNLLDMREPATGSVVNLSSGTDGGALTMQSNAGEAKLSVSKLGTSLHLRFGDRHLGVDVGEAADVNASAPFTLNGRTISFPTSDP